MSHHNKYLNEFAQRLESFSKKLNKLLPRYAELKAKKSLSKAEKKEMTLIKDAIDSLEIRTLEMQRMLSDVTFGNVTAIYYTLKESFRRFGPEWDDVVDDLQHSYRGMLRERNRESLN